jgi:putative N6-adenine-specific DNA methylase
VLVINPPYGERLRKVNMLSFYQAIGDAMKNNFKGYEAWIVSSDMEALKSIGLKPHARKTLYNGKLECKLLAFSLF